jgi:hypothetical protein
MIVLSYPRSPLESILNVAHSENKLSWQLGWAGEKYYASGAFVGCGLAWDKACPWAKRLSWQTQGGWVK